MRHSWERYDYRIGPRGGLVLLLWCRRCGVAADSHTFSRQRVPMCHGEHIFDPGEILWHQRMAEMNRRHQPARSFDAAFAEQLTIEWE